MIDFDIEIPELKITPEEQENRIKRLLTNDQEKGEGLLSLILVFVKKYGPLAITELKDLLQTYLKKEIERVTVFRQSDRLVKLGLLYKVSSGEILAMDELEKEIIHRHIESKHRKFLSTISIPFRNTYNNRNYVWIANDEGERYIEWSCKLNKFSYRKKDGKKD